jgi:hypothetical protein
MKKTLQDQYLLIKEGKGHKGVFLTEAKRQFPNIVRNAATFEEAAASLQSKNIISENVIGLTAVNSIFEPKKKESYELAYEAFLAEAKKKENEDEKVKAEEKKVSKPVEKDYSRNFDRKDDKNIDNLIFDQVMTGYYAEMKDPKNADKTMQELKDIVMKNLQKDPIFYTKDGQFGVKGLGYTTEAPGLGTPKEAKGKYKSSGYGDLKEGYDKFKSDVKDLATKKSDKKFSPEEIKAKLDDLRNKEDERRIKSGEKLNEKAYLGAYGNYPHQSTPLDIEDYLEQVEGMSKSEAIEYLGKQGLSSSQALKVISQMDTDVRDMFDDTDVKIYGADDLYEQKIRKAIREMIAEELNSGEFEDTLFKLEQPHLGDKEALTTIQKIYARHSQGLNSAAQNLGENEVEESYQIPSVNTSGTSGGGGRRFIPSQLPFPQNIRKRFGEHIVYNPGSQTLYISAVLYNNLVKGYANHPEIKKLIMGIPPMVKQVLNKPDNYGPTTDLNTYLPDNLKKEFDLYHPLNSKVEKAKADKFNKAGDKQYWSEGDFLIPNMNIMEEGIMESLKESVEKDLSDINKEAEQEVLQTKLEKIDALIDHRRSKLSKLDEDEDMKALTDKKKVKELEKDIKALENAKKKVEKIMSKFKGKKKEVIDETEDELADEYIEDADERQDDGEKTDSILSNYNNLSFNDRVDLRGELDDRAEEKGYSND